ARHDVRIVDRLQQHRNAGRLVLAVAVHRHQHIDLLVDGVGKRGDQGGTVTAVLRMRDDGEILLPCQQLGGAIGPAVVDNQDAGRVTADLGENVFEVPLFVVDRNGGKNVHAAPPPGCGTRSLRYFT